MARGKIPARIAARFAELRLRKETALIAYVTVGDPNLRFTERLVLRLVEAGADVIELGVPYSDPVADGPVIQRASQRALRKGTSLADTLRLAKRLRRRADVPLVLFSYYNPILRMGLEKFARRAAAAGIDGVLVTDLPPEESAEFIQRMRGCGIDTVFLVTPTSSAQRIARIVKLSRGFVYVVARRGVTGARSKLPREVTKLLRRIRSATRLPLAVGFGIAAPSQVAKLSRHADGVVVGSALVECCERYGHKTAALDRAAALVRRLKQAGRGARQGKKKGTKGTRR